MSAIRNKNRKETSSLFNSFAHIEDSTSAKTLGETDLIRLLPGGARLKGTNKSKTFTARARSDGKVRFKGRLYSSLSLAAKAAIKRSTNGWWFWQIERGKGNWIRLTKIRKAGTPIYAR
jgi:hypothetical protein